ncbi:hypothetical protein ACSBL2_08260 [Pedobacter sp. AW31-3R]|uniref:hypothetical protein n=1 Tax=Pedobacter sp. AW31-3R TaxID=3445781 RepID=UPI003FA118C1
MNILLLSGFLIFSTITFAGPGDVYICNNKKAEKYHYSPTCRGLSNCQFKIVKITAKAAKNKGMTLCAWETKNKK